VPPPPLILIAGTVGTLEACSIIAGAFAMDRHQRHAALSTTTAG
jgi:hypothetical protein